MTDRLEPPPGDTALRTPYTDTLHRTRKLDPEMKGCIVLRLDAHVPLPLENDDRLKCTKPMHQVVAELETRRAYHSLEKKCAAAFRKPAHSVSYYHTTMLSCYPIDSILTIAIHFKSE